MYESKGHLAQHDGVFDLLALAEPTRQSYLIPIDDSGVPDDVREVAAMMRSGYQSSIPKWYDYKDHFDPVKILNTDVNYDAAASFVSHVKDNFTATEEVKHD